MVLSSQSAFGATLTNGDFSNGLTNWATTLTPDGETNFQGIENFETVDGTRSDAAAFQPGSTVFNFFDPVFGGVVLSQTFTPGISGRFELSIDYASFNPTFIGSNRDAGAISLLLDDQIIDSVSLGDIDSRETIRGSLSGEADLVRGMESVFAVSMIRGARSSNSSPIIHIDNASIKPAVVPLPATLGFLVFGLVSLVGLRFSRRSV